MSNYRVDDDATSRMPRIASHHRRSGGVGALTAERARERRELLELGLRRAGRHRVAGALDAFLDRLADSRGVERCAGVQDDELQEGVHFEIDLTTGVLTFDRPPLQDAVVTAGFEFDVPVRFDTDRIAVSVASFQAGQVPDVPVVELRV